MFLAVALTLYLLGFVFLAYFCLFADPDTSTVADLLTRRLPDFLESQVVKLVGKKCVNKFSFVAEYFLQILYLVIVLGSWSIIFAYAYPWVTESKHVSDYHKIIGVFVFAMCMASWRYASNSSPGFITARTLAKFDHFPYDNLLFVPGRTCPTVGIPRLARSKYDRFSHVHVARFDHFCGWLHNPIGEENYRFFLLFLLVHVCMCYYGSAVFFLLFRGEIIDKGLLDATFFNSATGEEFKANWFIMFQYLFHRHTYMAGVTILIGCMSLVLSSFLAYHVWITTRGMTTNEAAKWGQVKKWHEKESKRYRQAVKAGLAPPVHQKAASGPSSVVTDGDIGCTGSTGTDSAEETGESSPLMDPGPMPKNAYNNGLVENWKEVIFPRSLRKDALKRWKRSLQDPKTQQPEPVIKQPAKPKVS
jgi:palmitoyltransferase